MQNTTLCYLEHQGQYLMLLRNKKKHDINKQKWIGMGGHLLEKETPDECVVKDALDCPKNSFLNCQLF